MNIPVDKQINKETVSLSRIESAFTEAAKEMGVQFQFGGYFNEDSNVRALTTQEKVISFNTKYTDIPTDELQRLGYHEMQHANNIDEDNEENTDKLWAFMFTSQFEDLYKRMYSFYKNEISRGTIFEKKMYDELPANCDEIALHKDSYDNWDELLAHLKAYEIYLRQKVVGLDIKTQPYEFIEAFVPDDLKLLDETYRQNIVNELGDKLDSFRPNSDEISITNEEL